MPFFKIPLHDSKTPPPPFKPWFFYNSSAQIDDPAFSLPSTGGPTTAAGALTSEAFGSISLNSTSSSNANSAAATAAASASAAAANTNTSASTTSPSVVSSTTTSTATSVASSPYMDATTIQMSQVSSASIDSALASLRLSEESSDVDSVPSSYGIPNLKTDARDKIAPVTASTESNDNPSWVQAKNTAAKLYKELESMEQKEGEHSQDPKTNRPSSSSSRSHKKHNSHAKKSNSRSKHGKKPPPPDYVPTDPPVFATVTFSGALAPTASAWTAFNPNDNLALEEMYQKKVVNNPRTNSNNSAMSSSPDLQNSPSSISSFNASKHILGHSHAHSSTNKHKSHNRGGTSYSAKSNDDNEASDDYDTEQYSDEEEDDEILVGIRRLYRVSVRELLIKPVYWKPIRDTSYVVRCEWFFSSTLSPVEPSLEAAVSKAFHKVKPWTSDYADELKMALQVPEMIDKIKIPISYTLTPEKPEQPTLTFNAVVVFAPCLAQEPIEPCEDKEEEEKQQSKQYSIKPKSKTSNSSLPSDSVDPIDTASLDSSQSSEIDMTDIKEEPTITPESTQKSTQTKEIPCVSKPYPIAYIFPPQFANAPRNPLSYLTLPTGAQLVSTLLAGRTPTGTLSTLQRHFDWSHYKKAKDLPDRPSDNLGFTPPPITELIFVIHGIGQKLSERLESFNFTYAINRFNILIAEQLDSPNVQQYLRKDTTIVALPINWRRTLDFESIKNASQDQDTGEVLFTLNQITMRSIPAIRNIVSDVMLDIPYYMSHYKKLLVDSTAKEANRIYKLFLKHNPQFEDYGRVHIIGHSLGSVLALDILSTQPTDIRAVNRASRRNSLVSDISVLHKKHHKKDGNNPFDREEKEGQFCFNTSNVIFAGSPVGFFLLLENSSLVPRKLYEQEMYEARLQRYLKSKSTMEMLHEKLILHHPSHESETDNDEDISSNQDSKNTDNEDGSNSDAKKPTSSGSSSTTRRPISRRMSFSSAITPPNYYPYGCMSVDRVYNVLHYSDPVAYCLNPTVDPGYAESLEQAILPTEKMFPIVKKETEANNGNVASNRAGSFFEGWKVRLPEIFSSSSTASTPTTMSPPQQHQQNFSPSSPLSETISSFNSPDQNPNNASSGQVNGKKKSETPPDSSVALADLANLSPDIDKSEKGCDDSQEGNETEGDVYQGRKSHHHQNHNNHTPAPSSDDTSKWTGRSFMSKILGTGRKRSDSGASTNSVSSMWSSVSIPSGGKKPSVSDDAASDTTETGSKTDLGEANHSEDQQHLAPFKTDSSGLLIADSDGSDFSKNKSKSRSSMSLPPPLSPREALLARHVTKSESAAVSRESSRIRQPIPKGNGNKLKPELRINDHKLGEFQSQSNTETEADTESKSGSDESKPEVKPEPEMTYAEKKMYMLNDNGQLDYIIPLVGTLENQYLSMLSAHSSYWDTRDFARLVAIECSRREKGPEHALKQYSAQRHATATSKEDTPATATATSNSKGSSSNETNSTTTSTTSNNNENGTIGPKSPTNNNNT